MSTADKRRVRPNLSSDTDDDPGMSTGEGKAKAEDRKAMKKPSRALVVFSDNLDRLMQHKPGTNSNQKVAALTYGKVSYKTVERIVKREHEPTLATAEAIAKVFGLQPWQMLVPGLEPGERPALQRAKAVEHH